jgi:hypothetical protein
MNGDSNDGDGDYDDDDERYINRDCLNTYEYYVTGNVVYRYNMKYLLPYSPAQ